MVDELRDGYFELGFCTWLFQNDFAGWDEYLTMSIGKVTGQEMIGVQVVPSCIKAGVKPSVGSYCTGSNRGLWAAPLPDIVSSLHQD